MEHFASLPPFLVSSFTFLLLSLIHAQSNHHLATGLRETHQNISSLADTANPSDAPATQLLQPGRSDTVPSLPVEWQATSSCALDLNDQLLGGLKEACSGIHIDRARCCPVLSAWLMAARAKFALQVPISDAPGMPLLPDDSMVCVASMKAALQLRGFYLTTQNSSCDVVFCFCNIRLQDITMANCPAAFYDRNFSQQQFPQPKSIVASTLPSEPSNSTGNVSSVVPSEPYMPRSNGSSDNPSLRALETNCKDHSYKGCTKCLTALNMVDSHMPIKKVSNKSAEDLDCKLMGLMWLLAHNKTLYIPTVSAVLRALLYSNHSKKVGHCSPDWANMPLALDSLEVQHSLAKPIRFRASWLYIVVAMLVSIALSGC